MRSSTRPAFSSEASTSAKGRSETPRSAGRRRLDRSMKRKPREKERGGRAALYRPLPAPRNRVNPANCRDLLAFLPVSTRSGRALPSVGRFAPPSLLGLLGGRGGIRRPLGGRRGGQGLGALHTRVVAKLRVQGEGTIPQLQFLREGRGLGQVADQLVQAEGLLLAADLLVERRRGGGLAEQFQPPGTASGLVLRLGARQFLLREGLGFLVQLEPLQEVEGLGRRQRTQHLHGVLTTSGGHQQGGRAEPISPLQQGLHLEVPDAVGRGEIPRALVRLARQG